MGFKENLQRRIEKNAVKSQMSWTDKKGYTHTEEVIFKRSRIPVLGDWQRVYPPINEDGKINWINLIFGGKKNFIKLILIAGLIFMVFFAFKEVFNSFEAFRSQECVKNCIEMAKQSIGTGLKLPS